MGPGALDWNSTWKIHFFDWVAWIDQPCSILKKSGCAWDAFLMHGWMAEVSLLVILCLVYLVAESWVLGDSAVKHSYQDQPRYHGLNGISPLIPSHPTFVALRFGPCQHPHCGPRPWIKVKQCNSFLMESLWKHCFRWHCCDNLGTSVRPGNVRPRTKGAMLYPWASMPSSSSSSSSSFLQWCACLRFLTCLLINQLLELNGFSSRNSSHFTWCLSFLSMFSLPYINQLYLLLVPFCMATSSAFCSIRWTLKC